MPAVSEHCGLESAETQARKGGAGRSMGAWYGDELVCFGVVTMHYCVLPLTDMAPGHPRASPAQFTLPGAIVQGVPL